MNKPLGKNHKNRRTSLLMFNSFDKMLINNNITNISINNNNKSNRNNLNFTTIP
jgi:hypothetical protein